MILFIVIILSSLFLFASIKLILFLTAQIEIQNELSRGKKLTQSQKSPFSKVSSGIQIME